MTPILCVCTRERTIVVSHNYSVRWLAPADLPRVMEIEQASYEEPWTERQIVKALGGKNAIGHVCGADKEVTDVLGLCIHYAMKN